MYVFDTSPLSSLFNHFYRLRFPTLWNYFDELVANATVTSTREVGRELERYGRVDMEWLNNNRSMFTTPTALEAKFVRTIYEVPHFRQNIELRKIQKGGLNADPFVIAKAATHYGTVVTLESGPPNGVKIPNICRHFAVDCINLEEFMERQGWEF